MCVCVCVYIYIHTHTYIHTYIYILPQLYLIQILNQASPYLHIRTKIRTAKIRYQKVRVGRVRWLTSVIPALWEAEAGGSQGQEIDTILANMVKPRLY